MTILKEDNTCIDEIFELDDKHTTNFQKCEKSYMHILKLILHLFFKI